MMANPMIVIDEAAESELLIDDLRTDLLASAAVINDLTIPAEEASRQLLQLASGLKTHGYTHFTIQIATAIWNGLANDYQEAIGEGINISRRRWEIVDEIDKLIATEDADTDLYNLKRQLSSPAKEGSTIANAVKNGRAISRATWEASRAYFTITKIIPVDDQGNPLEYPTEISEAAKEEWPAEFKRLHQPPTRWHQIKKRMAKAIRISI